MCVCVRDQFGVIVDRLRALMEATDFHRLHPQIVIKVSNTILEPFYYSLCLYSHKYSIGRIDATINRKTDWNGRKRNRQVGGNSITTSSRYDITYVADLTLNYCESIIKKSICPMNSLLFIFCASGSNTTPSNIEYCDTLLGMLERNRM